MKYTFRDYQAKRDCQPFVEALYSNSYFCQWFETTGKHLPEDQCINELLGWLGKGAGALAGGVAGLGRQLATGQGNGIWGGMKSGWNKAGDWDRQGGNWIDNKIGQGISWLGNKMNNGGKSMQDSAARSNSAIKAAQAQRSTVASQTGFDQLMQVISRMTPDQRSQLAAVLAHSAPVAPAPQAQAAQAQAPQAQAAPAPVAQAQAAPAPVAQAPVAPAAQAPRPARRRPLKPVA